MKRYFNFLLMMVAVLVNLSQASFANDLQPPSTETDYKTLRRMCKTSGCCLASVENMENSHGFRIMKITDGCPVAYLPNMLKCIDTFVWCEPIKKPHLKSSQ